MPEANPAPIPVPPAGDAAAELISQTVWLYFRFPLGLRMAEEMLAARAS